ncbi:MAG: PilZ domain-containing protein [Acidobacteria bacterium]|nr:PilZ domain-containing protein [Acidobacteriota bacterium]
MDRRETSRVPVRLPGSLTVLAPGAHNSKQDRAVPVVVKSISGNGASLFLNEPLRPGALVKLIVEDDLFLGEVVHSGPGEGGYHVGLHLDCALASLSGIRNLMLALFREAEGNREGQDGAVPQESRPLRNGSWPIR